MRRRVSSVHGLIEQARGLGFVAIGFSHPGRPMFFDQFRAWIAGGKHGEMAWIERHMPLREDPARLFEDCRTVITLAFPYSPNKPSTPDGFSVARYAEPNRIDYHRRLRELGKILAGTIKEQYPGTKTRVCVDSAPILERSFAYSSGIGFIGKNNMLIVPGHGSYLFLLEVLSTALLPYPKTEVMKNGCGSCRLCLDACPTGALEGPFTLNAAKCLSYLTIEHRGVVDGETARKMGDCFFGCDICQEVCPLNKGVAPNRTLLPHTDKILEMDDMTFKEVFGRTAFARPGLEKIKGNIKAVRGSLNIDKRPDR